MMMRLKRSRTGDSRDLRRGQALVIIAMSMLGLLVAAGLATDVGLILMRKAQFDRAVDAAALAGVPVVTAGSTAEADERGMQILNANGIPITKLDTTCPLDANKDYCGERGFGTLPGAQRYKVHASWTVPLAFMNLIKFNSITLTSTAEAEYYNTVDVYTSGNDQGLLQTANLELFGPKSCANYGDAYTPETRDGSAPNPYYNWIDPPATYTYRIAIPESYLNNLVRVELFDPQTANFNTTYTSDPHYPSGTSYLPTKAMNLSGVLVDINSSNWCKYNSGGDARTDRRSPCLHGGSVGSGAIDPANPYWYVRMDENRWYCGSPGSYTPNDNTTTKFILYYFQEQSTGTLKRINLAQFTGKSDGVNATEAFKTALMWVSPVQPSGGYATPTNEQMPAYSDAAALGLLGSPAEPRVSVDTCPSSPSVPCSPNSNGDFIINLSDEDFHGQPGGETEGIYEDPGTGVRHIYMDVQGTAGGSENNWALWVGPARSEDVTGLTDAPAFGNSRQLFIQKRKSEDPPVTVHGSNGLVAYGVGHLPMNSVTKERVRFPLAVIGPELSGAELTIAIFDADAGTNPPIVFYFDTIPQSDYSACWAANKTQCNAEGSDTTANPWQYHGIPTNFGDAYMCPGSGCWAYLTFDLPTDSDPTKPVVPFYGGRLMVDYQGGQQDSFGWYITVTARPALTE